MRFGYSFWGFLGDHKVEGGLPVSTPDGNATYSWSILYEAQRRGWVTYHMQRDRDAEAMRKHGSANFAAFSREKRAQAYIGTRDASTTFPELDVLLLEWRFPIPGRNTPEDRGKPGYQPDLERQTELLRHYFGTKTKVVVWDLDHKLTLEDEQELADYGGPDAVFETSVQPREQMWTRTRVEPPTIVADLLQHPLVPLDRTRRLVYIGSRYERDDVIEEWVKPASERWPGQVHFHGNWTREPSLTECRRMWPGISYHDRCTVRDFGAIYGGAAACPLLAKRSYLETGFITPRPWEALLFGTLPVGLGSHRGIEQYLPEELVAPEPGAMVAVVESLSELSDKEREDLRTRCAARLGRMDVSNFVDALQRVADGDKSLAQGLA